MPRTLANFPDFRHHLNHQQHQMTNNNHQHQQTRQEHQLFQQQLQHVFHQQFNFMQHKQQDQHQQHNGPMYPLESPKAMYGRQLAAYGAQMQHLSPSNVMPFLANSTSFLATPSSGSSSSASSSSSSHSSSSPPPNSMLGLFEHHQPQQQNHHFNPTLDLPQPISSTFNLAAIEGNQKFHNTPVIKLNQPHNDQCQPVANLQQHFHLNLNNQPTTNPLNSSMVIDSNNTNQSSGDHNNINNNQKSFSCKPHVSATVTQQQKRSQPQTALDTQQQQQLSLKTNATITKPRLGRGQKSKRIRTIFTPEQLKRLEQEFSHQMYLVGQDRGFLAKSLNLTESQVKVWFQNRRIKSRKVAPQTEGLASNDLIIDDPYEPNSPPLSQVASSSH